MTRAHRQPGSLHFLLLSGSTLALGALGALAAEASTLCGGEQHSAAIQVDGGVATWGNNRYGQLGNGSARGVYAAAEPTVAGQVRGARAVACGAFHTLALDAAGRVWAWGNNLYGQLGIGTRDEAPRPVRIDGLTTITALAAGDLFSLALDQAGSVWAWGNNVHGELGTRVAGDQLRPRRVAGLPQVLALAAGDHHVAVVAGDGTVWTWGRDDHGQLGERAADARESPRGGLPAPIAGVADAVEVAAGEMHTLIRLVDGHVLALGAGANGRLGSGAIADRREAGVVLTAAKAPAPDADPECIPPCAAAGQPPPGGWVVPGASSSAGLIAAERGRLPAAINPADVVPLAGIRSIAAGDDYSLALATDGRLFAWGYNLDGQLCLAGNAPRAIATAALDNVIDMTAGDAHTLLRMRNGEVWACGFDFYGQVGAPDHPRAVSAPLAVPGFDDARLPPAIVALDNARIEWQAEAAELEDGRLHFDGTAEGPSAYVLVSKPLSVGSGLHMFAVCGRLERGGLIMGLVNARGWIRQRSVTAPGEFESAIGVRGPDTVQLVVAHFLTDGSLRTAFELTGWGGFESARVPHEPPPPVR